MRGARRALPGDVVPEPSDDRWDRARGVALGAAAGAAAAGLWVGMSFAFDLTFHLQPALIGLAAGWGYRRGLGRRGRGPDLLAASVLTAPLVAAAATVIAVADRGLDPAGFVALVAAAGLAGGLAVLARG